VIKSIRIRWTVHVACIGNGGGADRDWVGKMEGKSQLEDLGLDGSIILKLILKKWLGVT
jgi:hypothetical protein